MIDPAYCRLMAEYNDWMNRKLCVACRQLPAAALHEDRGAFFKSIYLTLNHIAYSDLAFLSRFTGDPPEVPPLGEDLFGGYDRWEGQRAALDARLVDWAASLTTDWLALPLTYTSKVDGRTRTVPPLDAGRPPVQPPDAPSRPGHDAAVAAWCRHRLDGHPVHAPLRRRLTACSKGQDEPGAVMTILPSASPFSSIACAARTSDSGRRADTAGRISPRDSAVITSRISARRPARSWS